MYEQHQCRMNVYLTRLRIELLCLTQNTSFDEFFKADSESKTAFYY